MTAPAPTIFAQGAAAVSADWLNGVVTGVSSLPQLRAFTGTSGMTVLLRGTVAAGDGGQALYYWEPSSTAMDNGTTIIAATGTLTGRWLLLALTGGGGNQECVFVQPSGDVSGAADRATIQAAINLVQSRGGGNVCLNGIYYINAGLVVTGNATRITGATQEFFQAPDIFNEVPGSGGTAIIYNGTGSALTYGATTYEGLGSCGLDDVMIVATGDAVSSLTAVGLTLLNVWNFNSIRAGAWNFRAGVGFLCQANGSGNYSQQSTFYQPTLNRNLIGIRSNSTNGATFDNLTQLIGGSVQGLGPTQGIGLDIQQTSSNFMAYGTLVSNYLTCINIAGVSARMNGVLTETTGTHINVANTATGTMIRDHQPSSPGTDIVYVNAASFGQSVYDGAGTAVAGFNRIGSFSMRPSTNHASAFLLADASALSLIDVNTSLKTLSLANAMDLIVYSDNFVTQVFSVDGATGNIVSTGTIVATGGVTAGGSVTAGAYVGSAGITTSSPSAGVGYATGAGGTVTQATDKTTTVVLNKTTGAITMNAAALAASTSVGFTLTNSAIAANDVVMISIKSGATANSYLVGVDAVAAGSCHIHLRNVSAGSLSEAVVLNFVVIKGVAA